MKIRITSIAWQGLSDSIGSITVEMEDALSKLFKGLSFGAGIDQLTVVIVSVSSEDSENDRISEGYNKIRRLRHPVTHEQIKSIGLGIPFNYNVVSEMSRSDLRKVICCSVLRKIAKPDIKIPRGFNYEEFSERISAAITTYSGTRSQ